MNKVNCIDKLCTIVLVVSFFISHLFLLLSIFLFSSYYFLIYINIEMLNAPDIKPIRVKECEVKQSKYPHCGKLPVRSVILGPSGSGKTVLLSNLILDVYRGCFARVYIFFTINRCRLYMATSQRIHRKRNENKRY